MEICRVTAARDVLFAPGAIFSVSRDFSNYLRIGWGGSWDQRIADGTSVVAAAISGAG
jgi:DNA-binding transcriptional MocR family regulator